MYRAVFILLHASNASSRPMVSIESSTPYGHGASIERSWDLKSFSAGLNTLKELRCLTIPKIQKCHFVSPCDAEQFANIRRTENGQEHVLRTRRHFDFDVDVDDDDFTILISGGNLFGATFLAHKYFYNVTNAPNYVPLFTGKFVIACVGKSEFRSHSKHCHTLDLRMMSGENNKKCNLFTSQCANIISM